MWRIRSEHVLYLLCSQLLQRESYEDLLVNIDRKSTYIYDYDNYGFKRRNLCSKALRFSKQISINRFYQECSCIYFSCVLGMNIIGEIIIVFKNALIEMDTVKETTIIFVCLFVFFIAKMKSHIMRCLVSA